MKTTLKAIATVAAIMIAAIHETNARQVNLEILTPVNGETKKFSANEKASKLAAKALKDFSKNFDGVGNADWVITGNGSFVAYFEQSEVKTKAYYDPKGRFEGTIKTYGESEMPADIRRTVKSVYFDYTITGVSEVETLSNKVWFVYIQNANSVKTLRITDDSMEITFEGIKQ